MNFQVPQFIERESKIAGPLTFKQFIYLGVAGLCVFFLYFWLAAKSFLGFVLVSLLLMITFFSFAFVKIQGRPLSTVLMNIFLFLSSAKLYLWKKKEEMTPITVKSEKREIKPVAQPITLKIAEKSQLKKLSTEIETGLK